MSNDDQRPALTRRAVLGSGAVAATAGGLIVAGATSAAAADGSPILAGRTTTASSATTLSHSANANGFRVISNSESASAHAIVASSKNGYGLIATSAGHNGAKLMTTDPDAFGLWAENGSDSAGAGAAIYAVHKSKGFNAQGTAIRGVNGPSADYTLNTLRKEHGPAGGEFAGVNGVVGATAGTGAGVIGFSSGGYGVVATSHQIALLAHGRAWVTQDLTVQGDIIKYGGAFRIDHPLDPENRYLSHSFVESPDMKNIYDGVVELDQAGSATIELPEWFETLNRDFRYQLTAIGAPAPELHVSAEIESGQFSIAGGAAGQRISWQVTGIRQDVWAEQNRIQVETDKPAGERGTYLYPEGFGKPASQRTDPGGVRTKG